MVAGVAGGWPCEVRPRRPRRPAAAGHDAPQGVSRCRVDYIHGNNPNLLWLVPFLLSRCYGFVEEPDAWLFFNCSNWVTAYW